MTLKKLIIPTVTALGLSVAAPLAAQGVAMFAVLVGGTELKDATGVANDGDTDGFGTATVIVHRTADTSTETLCFGVTVRAIDTPTAMHIHRARAGLEGAVAVTLSPLPTSGNPGTASGCVLNVPNATITALTNAPANFYINVHTAAFPGGALRGQLY